MAVLPLSQRAAVCHSLVSVPCKQQTSQSSTPFSWAGRVRRAQGPRGPLAGSPELCPRAMTRTLGQGLALRPCPKPKGKAQNHTWGWQGERSTRSTVEREKAPPNDAICFCLEAATLEALCQVSHSFNNYWLGPNEGQALGILLRTKKTRLFLPSWNSHSNEEKTMNVIKKQPHSGSETDWHYWEKKK